MNRSLVAMLVGLGLLGFGCSGTSGEGNSSAVGVNEGETPTVTPQGVDVDASVDASPSLCGNGELDEGELCDIAIPVPQFGCCPFEELCRDGDPCTVDKLVNDGTCDADCDFSEKLGPSGPFKDLCCPPGTSAAEDADCNDNCGNGVVDDGESCDPALPGSCPTECEDDGDPCTTQNLITADPCNPVCETLPVIEQISGDGCCPDGASMAQDSDCPPDMGPVCGDGVVDDGETCDTAIAVGQPGACPRTEDCSDGDPCTEGDDVIGAGTCTATCGDPANVDCNDDNSCTEDACVDGSCVNTGVDCDDQDACTADSCSNDECMNIAIDCDDGDACTVNGCDPASGCTSAPVDCNDGNACTADSCDPATGCANDAIDCDDGNECTVDGCDTGSGCTNDARTGSCADGAGECVDGMCSVDPCFGVDCDDGDACTVDSCDDGQCSNDAIDCDDQDACTVDSCSGGSCSNDAIDCSDGDACTVDACVDGDCVNTAMDCDDGDSCTTDSCSGGSCSNEPLDCDDGDACTNDSCSLGNCVNAGIDCSDGSACTADSCDPASGCVNSAIDCDDGSACTADSCDPASGCVNSAIDCDDGSACTADSCDPASGCVNSAIDCDDGSACTADSCDPASGCVNSAIDCDDGDACTVNACDAVLGCTSSALDCGSATECTAPGCDAATGCFVTNLDGNSCDGDTGTCDGGVCVPNPTDPAAYRVTNFVFEAPAFILPFSGCAVNQAGLVGGIVNGSITGDSEPDGLADLALLVVQNSDAQSGTIGGTLVAGDCQVADLDTCTPSAGAPTPALTFMHPGIGNDCQVSAKTIPSGASGCFLTAPENFTLVLGSVVVPLEAGQGGGQYNGNPATGVNPAHLAGFLSDATAKATILDPSLPLVGGLPISDLLRGDQCVGAGLDERVTGPSGALGFQFEIAITMDRVDNFTP